MYFKRLEMHGFKSFAEPVVIDFHEGVTCIVGPNGSGKSNISDAIRWVLGEQSPKALRGGKMEEVIFAGTLSRKSRGMAEVTLVIDNSTGILPIEYNEVAITRRMYRSGESEYLINNNQCRLRDIRELIMDTGIGVDGYSLIGQGKIADIVSNKPESRREIFEEAAGVVMYKSRKQEAEKKLSSTAVNLDRVNDIIGEIESRIDGLHEDSDKAKEALELRERRKDLEINITLHNVEKFNASNLTGKDDSEEMEKSINKLKAERNSLNEKLSLDRERNEQLETLRNDANSKLLEKVQTLNEITSQSKLESEKLSHIDSEISRLNEEIRVLTEKQSAEFETEASYEEKRAEIEKEQTACAELLKKRISEYNEAVSESLELNQHIEDLKNSIIDLNRDAAQKRSEKNTYINYTQTLENNRKQLEDESKNLEGDMKLRQEALRKAEEEAEEATEKGLKALEKRDGLNEETNKLDEELKALSLKIEELRIRTGQLTTRRNTIEEMESNYEGYNGAVKFIMKQGLRGIEGVTAELMKVPEGYETAIETALGAALQNIVVRTDADAKAAVRSLKENRAGRLTFLPMESVSGSEFQPGQAVKSARGFLGMGSSLIECDSRYDGIFGYLLGKTAVVDNLDTAVRLSKLADRGIRFVTVDGEIINASGAITGGRYKNASANLLSRRNEIETLTEKIEKLEKQSETAVKEQIELQNKKNALADELKKLDESLKELNIQEANARARAAALTESDREREETARARENKLRVIANDIENAVKNADRLDKEAKAIDSEIAGIEQEIAGTQEQVQAVKEKTEAASESVTAARISANDASNAIDSIEEILSRVLDSIDDYTEQIDAREEELEKIQKKKSSLLFGNEDSTSLKALQKEKEELEEYISGLTEEKKKLVDSINEQAFQVDAMGDRINSLADSKNQLDIRIAKNESQLENAKQKLWDDYEISYVQALEYKRDDFSYTPAVKESREIRNRLEELGDINVGAIEEYLKESERLGFLTAQRADIQEAIDGLNDIITDMDKTIKTRFKSNFDRVVINFEEVFKELFGGGHAELRLDDENNPLEAGIEIIAQPPGKKLQNINLMSGGEKTMTAIALMFAVLRTKPTPFCILDEVEAALDDSNIDRFASYLKKFDDIQFAIVTHQKATMEHADVLYGVTMPEQGVSKVLSLRLGDEFDI